MRPQGVPEKSFFAIGVWLVEKLLTGELKFELVEAGDVLLPKPLELTDLVLKLFGVVSLEYALREFRKGTWKSYVWSTKQGFCLAIRKGLLILEANQTFVSIRNLGSHPKANILDDTAQVFKNLWITPILINARLYSHIPKDDGGMLQKCCCQHNLFLFEPWMSFS